MGHGRCLRAGKAARTAGTKALASVVTTLVMVCIALASSSAMLCEGGREGRGCLHWVV